MKRRKWNELDTGARIGFCVGWLIVGAVLVSISLGVSWLSGRQIAVMFEMDIGLMETTLTGLVANVILGLVAFALSSFLSK